MAQEARHVLLDYARRNQNDAAAHLLPTKAAIADGDTMTALGAVTKTEQNAPHHPEVLFVRAVIHWKRGESDAAATILNRFLRRAEVITITGRSYRLKNRQTVTDQACKKAGKYKGLAKRQRNNEEYRKQHRWPVLTRPPVAGFNLPG